MLLPFLFHRGRVSSIDPGGHDLTKEVKKLNRSYDRSAHRGWNDFGLVSTVRIAHQLLGSTDAR